MTITWLEIMTTLIEGLMTFVSPCVLPMIPVYVLYFTGNDEGRQARKTLLRALCFVAGFTALFVLLGVFAGTLGGLLVRYQSEVNLLCGVVMILFGLHYADAQAGRAGAAQGLSFLRAAGRGVCRRLDAVHRAAAGFGDDARRR